MKLDAKAFGLAAGILWGLCVFLCTLWVMWRGGGEHFILLAKFYPAYSVTPLGAFLGLVYGFIDGFIGGWVLAWLYNRFARTAS
jgi:hypothetical protein